MTLHRDPAPVNAADSGIALQPSGGAAAVPVSPAGCLAVAHALVAGMHGGAAAAWARAAADPAVAAWLAAEQGAAPSRSLATGLRAAIVTAAQGRGTPQTSEGRLLLDALAAAEVHEDLAARFEARVTEARLEAVRELAYGAGHEINNPLANIAARAQALLIDEREPERRRRLATIVDQAFRARDMIGGLMVFARPPRAEPVATTVSAVVEPALGAVAPRAAARGARVDYRPPPTPLGLHVDVTQVGEALRMLILNAVEAVEEGGRVLVEASGASPSSVRIVVDDDGPGMDPETAARAGDPFFSGREAGRGLGLGLPKARRLIESSGGSLAIDSRPSRGTRCIVELPMAATAGPGDVTPSNSPHVPRHEA